MIAKIQEEIWKSMILVNVKKTTKEYNVKQNVQQKLVTKTVITKKMHVNVLMNKKLGILIHLLAIAQKIIPEMTAIRRFVKMKVAIILKMMNVNAQLISMEYFAKRNVLMDKEIIKILNVYAKILITETTVINNVLEIQS